MAKEINRTWEEKNYRNKVAATLKNLRSLWSNDLANTLIEREKNKDIYKDSQRMRVEVREQVRTLNNDELKEVLQFIEQIKNRNILETPKPVEYNEQPKPEGFEEQPKPDNNNDEEDNNRTEKYCDKCWAENPIDANFCHVCGASFCWERSINSNEENNEDNERIVFVCKNCWNEDHELWAKYCHNCGSELA